MTLDMCIQHVVDQGLEQPARQPGRVWKPDGGKLLLARAARQSTRRPVSLGLGSTERVLKQPLKEPRLALHDVGDGGI